MEGPGTLGVEEGIIRDGENLPMEKPIVFIHFFGVGGGGVDNKNSTDLRFFSSDFLKKIC